MSLHRYLLVWCALFATVPVTPAQQSPARSLSLEEALTLALPASETVGIARAGERRATADLRRARSGFFPQLSGAASYERLLKSQFSGFADEGDSNGNGEPAPSRCDAFTPDPTLPVTDRLAALESTARCVSRLNPFGDLGSLPFGRANTWSWGFSASQTLFAGGRVLAGVRAAEAGHRGAAIAVTAALAQTTLEVVEGYADAALADRLAVIARAALDQADTTLAQTALRREVGTAPEFDLLRATVARDNLRPQLIQAEAQREIAHQRLRQLLNLPGTVPLTLVTPLDDTTLTGTPSLAALVARAPDTAAAARTTVRQADEGIAAQDALRRAARGEYLPSVSIASQYGKIAYPSSGVPGWNDFYTNWNLSVGVQFPIFTGGRLRAEHEAARAGVMEAELRRQQALEGAALDARAALARHDAALATWAASGGTVEQAARAYAIAEVRYREGISTQTELLDARLAFQQAEATRATAARDLLVARVRVALLADLPLAAGTTATAQPPAISTRAAGESAFTSTGFGIP